MPRSARGGGAMQSAKVVESVRRLDRVSCRGKLGNETLRTPVQDVFALAAVAPPSSPGAASTFPKFSDGPHVHRPCGRDTGLLLHTHTGVRCVPRAFAELARRPQRHRRTRLS